MTTRPVALKDCTSNAAYLMRAVTQAVPGARQLILQDAVAALILAIEQLQFDVRDSIFGESSDELNRTIFQAIEEDNIENPLKKPRTSWDVQTSWDVLIAAKEAQIRALVDTPSSAAPPDTQMPSLDTTHDREQILDHLVETLTAQKLPWGVSDFAARSVQFKDFDGKRCSLSPSDDKTVRLGARDQHMRLSRETVIALLPVLQHFAVFGELPTLMQRVAPKDTS